MRRVTAGQNRHLAAPEREEMTDETPAEIKLPDPVQWSRNMMQIAERSQRLVLDFMARQPGGGNMGMGDPLNVAGAFLDMTRHMMTQPQKLVEAQLSLWQDYLKLWQNTTQRLLGAAAAPIVKPQPNDRRFADAAWTESTLFDYIKQSYLLTARWLQATVREVDGLDDKTARKVDFYTRQFVDAMAPSNFVMTNPEVLRKTIETGGDNLVQGLNHLLDDLERGKGRLMIKMTDSDAFKIGENIAVSPGKVIFQNDLQQLIQYEPTTETVKRRPLLIIPPWINKYYILDLRPRNSFIRWAVEQGHTVFVTSWVNPDEHLAKKSFEDYMAEGPFAALDAIEQATGEREVNVIGYCLGGTLLAATLAYMAMKGDDRFASATYFVALTDFTEAGEISVFIDEEQLASLEERMRQHGYLEGRPALLEQRFDAHAGGDAQLLSAQHVSGQQAGAARCAHHRRRADRSAPHQDAVLPDLDQGGPYRAVEIDLCRDAALWRAGQVRAGGVRPHRRHRQPAGPEEIWPLGESEAAQEPGGLARRRQVP
jgi:polyhydroxyalkanoate synthase subunit PhaC